MANKLKNFIQDGQKVTLNYEDGELELRVLTPEIVRVFENRGNASNSYAIAGDKEIKTNFRIEEKDDHAELSTEKLFVKIYDDKKIDVYDEKDHPLIIDYRGERTPIDRQMDEEHKKLAESEGHEVAGSKKKIKTIMKSLKN